MSIWHWLMVTALFQNVAFGYIDPGPGHILVQLFSAMALGSLFYIKRIFAFVKGLFSRRSKQKGQLNAETSSKKGKGPKKAA